MPRELHRKEKIKEVVTHAASDFILKESNKTSMITVTDVNISNDFQNARIFVTVFPENDEKQAIAFLKRNRNNFKEFIKKNTRLQHIPWFDFEIDGGEKSRQRIDIISRDL